MGGKQMEKEVHINWAQFITSLATTFIVAAGGAAVTIMASQASTDQRLAALEQRAGTIERTISETNKALTEINTRLSRIEGKLDAQK